MEKEEVGKEGEAVKFKPDPVEIEIGLAAILSVVAIAPIIYPVFR